MNIMRMPAFLLIGLALPSLSACVDPIVTGPAAASAATALGGVGLSALGYAADSLRCQNEPLAEVPAPEGSMKAVVFRRDCRGEATTTEVSLLPQREALPDGEGNVFSARYEKAAAGLSPQVSPGWVGPRQLAIGYDRRARMTRAEPEFGGVELSYGTVGSGAAPVPSGSDG